MQCCQCCDGHCVLFSVLFVLILFLVLVFVFDFVLILVIHCGAFVSLGNFLEQQLCTVGTAAHDLNVHCQ